MANLGSDARILTFNQSGYYVCVSQVTYVANATGRRIVVMQRNGFYAAGTGDTIASSSSQALTEASATTTALCFSIQYFNVGDFIASGTYQTSGGALNEGQNANSFLTVMRISA